MKKFATALSLLAWLTMTPAFAAPEKTAAQDPAAQVAADVKAESAKAEGVKAESVKDAGKKATAPSKAQISKPIIDGKDAQKASKPEAVQAAKTVAKTTPVADNKTIQKKTPVQPAAASAPIQNYVGEIKTYRAKADDTLLSIGERESLGYVELRSANPEMDPWRPGNGAFMILPKMHLLPDAPRKGIVVNLSEMRVYYYQKDGQVKTFPIGVGREGFSTPMGTTNVVRKARDPQWRPTDRMLREDPTLKASYGPGPDNPLGSYALYLGWPQYMLHGTNKPWGIGRRVSSGCIRMYHDDVEYLYNNVPPGTSVTTVRQPVKFGWIGEMLYIEAHPDGMLADQVERVGGAPLDYKVPPDLFADISRVAGQSADNIDWKAVRDALRDRRGYPVPVLKNATPENMFVTAAMIEKAGTERAAEQADEPVPGAASPSTPAHQAVPAVQEAAPARRPARSGGFNG